jgi:hypothetical protein
LQPPETDCPAEIELLIDDTLLKSSALSVIRGRWYSLCATPVRLKIKQFGFALEKSAKFRQFSRGIKKKHQMFVFTGICKAQDLTSACQR